MRRAGDVKIGKRSERCDRRYHLGRRYHLCAQCANSSRWVRQRVCLRISLPGVWSLAWSLARCAGSRPECSRFAACRITGGRQFESACEVALSDDGHNRGHKRADRAWRPCWTSLKSTQFDRFRLPLRATRVDETDTALSVPRSQLFIDGLTAPHRWQVAMCTIRRVSDRLLPAKMKPRDQIWTPNAQRAKLECMHLLMCGCLLHQNRCTQSLTSTPLSHPDNSGIPASRIPFLRLPRATRARYVGHVHLLLPARSFVVARRPLLLWFVHVSVNRISMQIRRYTGCWRCTDRKQASGTLALLHCILIRIRISLLPRIPFYLFTSVLTLTRPNPPAKANHVLHPVGPQFAPWPWKHYLRASRPRTAEAKPRGPCCRTPLATVAERPRRHHSRP